MGENIQKIEKIHSCFKHPFTMTLSGATGSGKSEWIQRLFENLSYMIVDPDGEKIIDCVLYCYGERNANIERMQKIGRVADGSAKVIVHWGAPNEDLIRLEAKKCRGKMLLILDDLMVGINQEFLDSIFTRGSHNWNMSVVLVTQHLFTKDLRVARNNSHYLILMRNPAGALQIRNLANQLFPTRRAYFLEAYMEATRENFGYLLVDMHPTTPDAMRLRTHIYPGELTIVFVSKE